MNTPRRLGRFFTAAFVAAILATSAAADVVGLGNASAPPPSSRPRGTFTSLEFPGGSLAELIAAINKTDCGVTCNLLSDGSEAGTRLPAFSFQNTDANSVISAVNTYLRRRDFEITQSGSYIFVVTKNPFTRIANQPPAPLNFQPFQIGQYLDNVSVDDVMEVIRVAWAFNGAHDPKELEFKYHAPTKMLFVAGPPEAITVASLVIPQLKPPPYSTHLITTALTGTVPVTMPTPAAEATRLQDWQQEILRRRAARGQGTGTAPAATEPAPGKN